MPPSTRGGRAARGATLIIGLLLFALGIVLIYQSRLGLSPWDVLNQGIAKHTALSFGAANVAVATVVLVLAWRLGATIGPGTLANAALVGVFVDLSLAAPPIGHLAAAPPGSRWALLLGGVLTIALGTALYIGAALGAGPRDSLMLITAQRARTRIGLVRGALEATVTATGFALGGTVGIGTLAFVVTIGPAVEAAFWTLQRSPLVDRRAPAPRHQHQTNAARERSDH
jgi:uncharacterized membrane protein YczE